MLPSTTIDFVRRLPAKIVNDCAEIANFLGEHERKIVRADRTTDIARRKKLAESIRQHERELCRLLTEFRGFFYAPG